jgi:cysteine-rich repeat protein
MSRFADPQQCVGASYALVCEAGRVGAGEPCDDGSRRDVDGCTNACTFGGVVLGGNATARLAAAFKMIGQAVTRGEGRSPRRPGRRR